MNSKYSQVEAIKRFACLESAASCGIGFDLGIANPETSGEYNSGSKYMYMYIYIRKSYIYIYISQVQSIPSTDALMSSVYGQGL